MMTNVYTSDLLGVNFAKIPFQMLTQRDSELQKKNTSNTRPLFMSYVLSVLAMSTNFHGFPLNN